MLAVLDARSNNPCDHFLNVTIVDCETRELYCHKFESKQIHSAYITELLFEAIHIANAEFFNSSGLEITPPELIGHLRNFLVKQDESKVPPVLGEALFDTLCDNLKISLHKHFQARYAPIELSSSFGLPRVSKLV